MKKAHQRDPNEVKGRGRWDETCGVRAGSTALMEYRVNQFTYSGPSCCLSQLARIYSPEKTEAKLLAVGMTPEVWVPPNHVRDLRALIAHPRRLVSQQTSGKNRLQSVLQRHHIVPPSGKLYHPKHHAWWLNLDLAPGDKAHRAQKSHRRYRS